MPHTHTLIGGYGAGMRPATPAVPYPPLTDAHLLALLGPDGIDPILVATHFARPFAEACAIVGRDLTDWTAAAIDGALAFVHYAAATRRIDALVGVIGPAGTERDRAAYVAEARAVLGDTARITVLLAAECAPVCEPTGDVEQV